MIEAATHQAIEAVWRLEAARLIGGLVRVPEAPVAQRIVRAKRTVAEAHVPFELPRGYPVRPPPHPRSPRCSIR